jgi:hypothetical protein
MKRRFGCGEEITKKPRSARLQRALPFLVSVRDEVVALCDGHGALEVSMARTARRKDGGDTLTELMREVGAEPRRRGPRGPRHRAEAAAPAKVKLPASGKVRRISALSAGGVIVGGLMVVLLAPSDAVDVISGIPPAPPSLTIVPQAVEVPDGPAATSTAPSAPQGGAVAPPPPRAVSLNGAETSPPSSAPAPAPAPAPTTSPAPAWPGYPQDPRANPYYGGGYGGGYYGGGYGGGYYGGGRYPQPGGYYR